MKIIQSKLLSAYSNLLHGFTTKAIKDFHAIDLPVYSLKQIHSGQVYCYEDIKEHASKTINGDALVTRENKIAIGVRTADCVPLLVYDPRVRVVAVIHAGWRGAIAGIIENTISVMHERFGVEAKDLLVSIGPALCSPCFEIGPEVAIQFKNKFGATLPLIPGISDRTHVDLREGCRLILKQSGVLDENIEIQPDCTGCRVDLFYSYRKGDRDGRMLAFIGMKSVS